MKTIFKELALHLYAAQLFPQAQPKVVEDLQMLDDLFEAMISV